jgi:hypothetical protein
MKEWPPQCTLFVAAFLTCLLARAKDFTTALKTDSQRTPDERRSIKGGLGRSLFFDLGLGVPASGLLILLVSPVVTTHIEWMKDNPNAGFAILGIMSYGFPWVAFRRFVVRIVLHSFQEMLEIFSSEMDEPPDQQRRP